MIPNHRRQRLFHSTAIVLVALTAFFASLTVHTKVKPNILFIMGDNIGSIQPSIYHRDPMVGETPKSSGRLCL